MPDAAPLHDVAALVPGAVAGDPFGIGVDRGDRARAPVVPVPAVVFVPTVSPPVLLQGPVPEGSSEEITLCRNRHERYFPVRLPAPLHDAAFPVCQVSLLVEYGSLVFAFQKLPAHIFCFLTALPNTIFYAIALRPLFQLTLFTRVPGSSIFSIASHYIPETFS